MKGSRITRVALWVFALLFSITAVIQADTQTQRIKDNGKPVTVEEWNQAVDYLIQNMGKKLLLNMDKTIESLKEHDTSGRSFKVFRDSVTSKLKPFLQRSGFHWGNRCLNKHSFELLEEAIARVRGEGNSESGGQQPSIVGGPAPHT